MARQTDQKTTAIEKVVCYIHRSQEEGQVIPWGATWGSTRVSQEAGSEVTVGESLYCGFHREEWVRQGKQVWDWLV